jgi:hypothetical protein
MLIETASETTANVSIGDLDGDGHLDLVLAKGRHWPLVDRVLLNDGHGRFSIGYALGSASDRSYSAPLGDLDGDGSLDVVISNDRPDPKLVYLNDGAGHFRVGSQFGLPEWPTRNAALADLDGDGRLDIVVANRSADAGGVGSNFVCPNHGGGDFAGECIAFSQESSTTITAIDIDRDGLVDLVVPHRDGGQSFIYFNDGRAHFPRRVPFGPPDAMIRSAQAVDLDGDGQIDLVAIDEKRGLLIFAGRPDKTFATARILATGVPIPYALAIGDLDRDGRPDIVVGHLAARSTIYFNDGSGQYTAVGFGDGRGDTYGLAIGDLDGDGWPDIAAARSGAPSAVYFSR